MESDLLCNRRSCRKILDSVAWITSCSHVFCEVDGSHLFKKGLNCPICNKPLSEKYDIVRHELQPSERYKCMILAGLKPNVILEVCSRALTFWCYQVMQENKYQEYIAKKTEEKLLTQEDMYKTLIIRTNNELQGLKAELKMKSQELEALKLEYMSVSEQMHSKIKKLERSQAEARGANRRFRHNPLSPTGSGLSRRSPIRAGGGEFFNRSMSLNTETGRGSIILPPHRPSSSGDQGEFVFLPRSGRLTPQ